MGEDQAAACEGGLIAAAAHGLGGGADFPESVAASMRLILFRLRREPASLAVPVGCEGCFSFEGGVGPPGAEASDPSA